MLITLLLGMKKKLMMENNSKINSVYFINYKDIKHFDEKNGLVLKRKYGDNKREVLRYDTKR